MYKYIPDEILGFMAAKFRMLSDPTRLAILRTLMFEGERNVGLVAMLQACERLGTRHTEYPNNKKTADGNL